MNSWQPTISNETLKTRADILHRIRAFFAAREVLEVETPLLCHTSVTDPYIQSIVVTKPRTAYLQTSPEYAMKRLLANGSGSIYQICKAFRQEESGRYHNPEFTMLEWYRIGFDHHALMQEVDALLQTTVQTEPADKLTYEQLFLQHLQINPHTTNVTALKNCAAQQNILFEGDLNHVDDWLQLLLSHCIEPTLGLQRPVFIYDFPASQAALSRLQHSTPPVASRFEVYWRGVELANGFHELLSAAEQRARFEKNNILREQLNLPAVPLDNYLLSALEHGLPDCAGVALGIDRLILLALNKTHLDDVITFPTDRA